MKRSWISALIAGLCLGCSSQNNNVPADASAGVDATALDVVVDAAGDTADVPAAPPRMCREGTAWNRARPAFRNTTDDWGLGDLQAKRLATADLDNDGYADLIAWNDVTNTRTDFSMPVTQYTVRVLMNRPREGGAGRRFVEATRTSNFLVTRDGAKNRGRMVQAVAFADVDNDGDLDAYSGAMPTAMPAAGSPMDPGDRGTVLLNDGHGVFSLGPTSDATPDADVSPQTIGAVFLDHDRDGNVDLFVAYHSQVFGLAIGQQSQLFHNDGTGAFADITDAAGLTLLSSNASLLTMNNNRPLYGVTACDVSGDGRLDLIGAAYGRQFNFLFRSDGDGFVDESVASKVGGDDNRDFSDNQTYRCYCQANAGRCPSTVPPPVTGFTCGVRGTWNPSVDERPWRLNGNTFSIACGDVDNDGDLDLYTGEITHPDVGLNSDRSELLVNHSDADGTAHFERPGRETMGLAPPISRNNDEGILTNAFFDFDSDGKLDLWAGGSDYPGMFGWLFQQGDAGQFREVSQAAGVRHACPLGLALADFDHDGDVDMVVATSLARTCATSWMNRAVTRMYENDVATQNWTSIRLVGRAGGANRAAIGARVRVTAGGVTQTREVQGNWGLAGIGAELDVHVGLGAQCAMDRIEVRWPDAAGTVETFENIPANYRLEITQGAGRVRYLTENP